MKVTSQKTVDITIQLTQDEASKLKTLIGKLPANVGNDDFFNNLYAKLDESDIDSDKSFSAELDKNLPKWFRGK